MSNKHPSTISSLPKIPFEVLIGCFHGKDRNSFPRSTINSKERIRRNTFSARKGNVFSIEELRTKFEEYLNEKLPVFESKCICQKLQFLDMFCERMKGKIKSLNHISDVFTLCDNYLYELIKENEKDGSIIIQHNGLKYCFLEQFEEMTNNNQDLLPVFSSHEYLKSWFITKQQEYLKSIQTNEIKDESNDEFQDGQLSILTDMLLNQMYDHFVLFQENNSKYCKKWMKENVSELPDHLFETLKKEELKNEKYKQFFLANNRLEAQFSHTTVLDVDFEIINHFSQSRNSTYNLHPSSQLNETLLFSSPVPYLQFKGAKFFKVIHFQPLSIVQFTKGLLSYRGNHKDDLIAFGDPEDYQKLDMNKSSRKYSSVIYPVTLQLNSILQARNTRVVYATKAKIINNELVETTIFFKTCNTDVKNPFITVGGIVLKKDDTNRTRVLETRMNYFGGVLQTDFALNMIEANLVKKTKSFYERILNHAKELDCQLDEEKEELWRTFCDYCREHCKVDPNIWN